MQKKHMIIIIILMISTIGIFTINTKTSITGMTPLSIETPWYEQKVNGYYTQETVREFPNRPQKAPTQAHKIEAMDYVRNFFGTTTFLFPEDPCAQVIEEQLKRVNYLETARIETFSGGTGWTDKYRTLLFEGEKMVGEITLVQGFGDPNRIKLYYDITKAIVSINSWQENMKLRIELDGINEQENIFFTRGSLKVMDFKCSYGY